MKKLIALLLTSVVLVVAGCGNNNSSSTGASSGVSLARGENTVVTSTGGMVHVVFDDRGIAGSPIRIKVTLREPGANPGEGTGTLNWGDNTTDRVRDDNTVVVKHIYPLPGTYTLAIQPDGADKVVVWPGCRFSRALSRNWCRKKRMLPPGQIVLRDSFVHRWTEFRLDSQIFRV